jgi:hypothetical protein
LLDPKLVTPILVAALLALAVVRRTRRTFGRQPVRAKRMGFRVGVLAFVGALAAVGAVRDLSILGALIGGLAGGAVLGYVGLRQTRFEVTSEGRFYTPHTYIGLIVTVLFVGRLAYRLLSAPNGAAFAAASQGGSFNYHQSPMTMAIFGALLGYYLVFNLGVLHKTQALAGASDKPPAP